MILVIAEKKELALAICEALPGKTVKESYHFTAGSYVVAYLAGHALELLQPNEIDEKYKNWKAEDLPIFFRPWPKKVMESKIKLMSDIGKFLKTCEYVIHAGDNDDEGQYLVDEVLEYFKYTGRVMRLDTANTSKPALEKSLKNMTNNAEHISAGKAAEARQLSDALFGYSLSRHFSIVNHRKLAVGRVQTPTLGLVVQRDALIDGHSKTFYYELFGNFIVGDICIKAKFYPEESSNILDEEKRCLDEGALEDIKSSLLVGEAFSVDISIKEEKEAAPLPFNLVKLQTYANKKFGYSPSQVMEITQSLRDNHKAITYNRSDCQYLSEEHFDEAPETVAKVLSNIGYAAHSYDIDTNIKSKCFNSKYVTLHFAIIPTAISLDISKLSQDELNIYKAISERYLMQFIPPLTKEVASFSSLCSSGAFKASESKVIYAGYKLLSADYKDDEDADDSSGEEEESRGILRIGEGQHHGTLESCNIERKETKPPKRYTLASLNEDLTRIVKYVKDPEIKAVLLRKDDGKKGENGSIGTSATRSSIIENLLKRGYLEMKGKSVISTELGKKFYSILPDSIKFADTTAVWWLHQEAIIAGTEDSLILTDSVLEVVKQVIDTCKEQKIQSSNASQPIGKCPKCEADVVHVNNPKLKAYCCSNRECKFILWETQYGSKLSESNAKLLLGGKPSAKMKFKSKTGKSYEARLKLTGEKVELVFDQSSPKSKSSKK